MSEDSRRPLTKLAQAGRRADWTGMPGQPGAIVQSGRVARLDHPL